MTDLSRLRLLTLLLCSYRDLLPGLQKGGEDIGYISRGKKSGASKAPQHVGEERALWQQGSYDELHRALHKISNSELHAVTITWIIRKPASRDSREHLRYILRFRETAEQGRNELLKHMPRNIRVPVEVLEDAGHVRRPA